MEKNILFGESQLGLKNWVISSVTFFIAIPVNAYLLYEMVQINPPESYHLLGTIIFVIIVALFLASMKLKVTVLEETVTYRLSPFHFSTQTISKDDIIKIENVVYNPIGEWGGWGIRYNFRGDKAYTMYGNKGVQITLKSGKIVLFGSQKPDELYNSIITNTNLSD